MLSCCSRTITRNISEGARGIPRKLLGRWQLVAICLAVSRVRQVRLALSDAIGYLLKLSMAVGNVIRHRLLAGFSIGAQKSNTPMGYLLNFASKDLERLSVALDACLESNRASRRS